jgi:hypothetical protein
VHERDAEVVDVDGSAHGGDVGHGTSWGLPGM